MSNKNEKQEQENLKPSHSEGNVSGNGGAKYIGSKEFGKHIILLFTALLTFSAIVAAVYFLSNRAPEDPLDGPPAEIVDAPGGDGRGILVTEENVESIRNEVIDDTQYTTSMTIDWDFPTWNTPSPNAYIGNSTKNTRIVYVDIYLASTDEDGNEVLGQRIYSSPYIPVGAVLTKFPLDVELAKGDYSAVCKYNLVDDNFNVITDLKVAIDISVQA